MGRTILAILAGLLVAVAVIALVELVGIQLYPPSMRASPTDVDAFAQSIAAMPPVALGFVLLAWFLGSLTGAFAAARISRQHPRPAAIAVGLVVLTGVAAVLLTIPHPLWMQLLGPVAPVLGAWLGLRDAGRKRSIPPTTP